MPADHFLETKYIEAMEIVGSDTEIKTELPKNYIENLSIVLSRSESSKGVFTVFLTSLVYKILNSNQDIRNHQTSIENGYSGRTFDTKYVTPFLKEKKFPAMAESGWLTRSLEQKVPYNKDYSGAIRPANLKDSFLEIIELIETGEYLDEILLFIFQGCIIKRNKQEIDLAKPVNLPISTIINLLEKHFNSSYVADGASRLPVLALYASYLCLMTEAKRFEGKKLLDIESHTSADSRSGRIGDIDIIDERERAYEAVEVKHGIPISEQLILDAFEKFKTTQVKRYYLLSTVDIEESQREQIEKSIERIKNIHGCHVIANGLIPSLKYYLRLLTQTSEFIEHYVNLLEVDTALKYEHKKQWNDIISEM